MSPTESPPEPISESETKGTEPDMDAFRKEISALITLRNVPGEVDINVDDLNEKDANIWHKIKNYRKGLITMNDYTEYIQEIDQRKNRARKVFARIVANKLTPIWGNEELDQIG